METIVYNGACVELETTIELAATSRFIGWEISCFGLPASGELFTRGRYRQHYKVLKEGVPIFIDRLSIDDSNREAFLKGVAGMQQHTVSGFFVLGPFDLDGLDISSFNDSSADEFDTSAVQEKILLSCRALAAQLDMTSVAAISYVGNLFIGRYLGDSADQARQLFTLWWQLLRPLLLQREACPPRIWST